MSDLPLNLLMTCVVVILLACVGAWWLKGEGERVWREHQVEVFWADVAEVRRRMTEAAQELGVALREMTARFEALGRASRWLTEYPELARKDREEER